ncbi:MAG: serine/threonine protein kinase [Clostridiales bacterium]|nr:serine/threonine protein kinase [Clostridiales bacterium]
MDKKEYTLPKDSGYRIVRRLGSGGEGTVYLVCHFSTEQLRAAKVLTNIREDRRHELDMMKHLNHPSLPRVIDVLEQDGYLWLIMEFIQGCRLDQWVSQGMARDQIWSVARQLSQVLVYLHTRKEPVFHLDIKPSNILIRPDQTLVLIDFGASIRGHPLEGKAGKYGTRGFAAPEQQKAGSFVDARADIYGAGAVLYYCCFGHAPVKRRDRSFLSGLRMRQWKLGDIIRKCLEEKPENRYEDSRELFIAVCRAQEAEQFCKKLGKTVGTMALLFPVTGLLFYSSSDQKQMGGVIDQGEVFAYESDSFSDAGEIRTDHLENDEDMTMEAVSEIGIEENAENMTENTSEGYLEDTRNYETESTDGNVEEYHRLLDMAGGMGFSQAMECYKQAFELCPGDANCFLQLLVQGMADGLFDAEEEHHVNELIYAIPSGSENTALELLAADKSAYGLFTYRMGLAYWYYYDGTGGKSAAAWWFQLAIASQKSDSSADWFGNALILAKIGSYYGMLGSTSMEEEREAKEWDYWNDLKELWYLYQQQEENAEIRIKTAEKLLSLMVLKSGVLREYGASWEETTEILLAIEEFLAEETMRDDEKEHEKLKEQGAAARSALERTYQE